MDFHKKTILGLFDSSQKKFIIPVYQRAYSWEHDQWRSLMEDLKEQIRGTNNYFFGNVLLETIIPDQEYEVIDGQQRLTTLSILIRAILLELSKRKEQGEKIDVKLADKQRLFFKDGGNKKIRPVDYDTACYDALIIDGKPDFPVSSSSQTLIKGARSFFQTELVKEDTATILQLLKKIESSQITTIELGGKKDAALMFELQNNRGKDLTNMERLKSYFMYQMYVYSTPAETATNIEDISNIFKKIYSITNDIKSLNEDSILIYHCNAFLAKGYNYRTLEDLKDVFKSAANKVKWIKDFIHDLYTSFTNVKKIETCTNRYFLKLKRFKLPAWIYPFLIKGYKYFSDDDIKLDKLYHIMEILLFRYYLINSRADFISRLNELLVGFDGNVDDLKDSFKKKLNDSWYWGDDRVFDILDGWMYENSALRYLLWEYESEIQMKGYAVGKMELVNEQIEHISPQTPPEGVALAVGYEVDSSNCYTDDFKREYLNCLGNLMLISGSHNASIGNRPFSEKLASYNNNPLLNQQAEIKNFNSITSTSPQWDCAAIDKRHVVIHDFAIKTWSFDSI